MSETFTYHPGGTRGAEAENGGRKACQGKKPGAPPQAMRLGARRGTGPAENARVTSAV